jgi:hypothetical protein
MWFHADADWGRAGRRKSSEEAEGGLMKVMILLGLRQRPGSKGTMGEKKR